MLRRFLLPLLGIALFATEVASAQTAPAAKPTSAYNRPVARTGRTLTAREKRAAEAAAKVEAAAAAKQAAAEATASASAWSGWSNDASQATEVGNGQHRPSMNVSAAPGVPLNQVGHGVSTDYSGRPLYREASTTLSSAR
jgi:hypothetical protein